MTGIEKLEYIFNVLEATNTPITKFSDLTGISRATIHSWKRGGAVAIMPLLDIAYKEAVKVERDVAK